MTVARSSLATTWFFFLLAVIFLLRSNYLLIDEEFFIVVAFLTFLAFMYRQVAGDLGGSLDGRISVFHSGLTQARDVLVRVVTGLYGFYNGQKRSVPAQPALRFATSLRLTSLLQTRWADLDIFFAHHSLQHLRAAVNLDYLVARTITLVIFYNVFVRVSDSELLNPFMRRSGLDLFLAPVEVLELSAGQDSAPALVDTLEFDEDDESDKYFVL